MLGQVQYQCYTNSLVTLVPTIILHRPYSVTLICGDFAGLTEDAVWSETSRDLYHYIRHICSSLMISITDQNDQYHPFISYPYKQPQNMSTLNLQKLQTSTTRATATKQLRELHHRNYHISSFHLTPKSV